MLGRRQPDHRPGGVRGHRGLLRLGKVHGHEYHRLSGRAYLRDYHLGGIDVSTMDDDQQAEIRNKMLGFIFQQYNLIPKLNVLENVELPLLYAGVDARSGRSEPWPPSSG